MEKINIGILREGRIPTDKRVPLLPDQCREIARKYSNVSFYIQPSPDRCIKDEEYTAQGIEITEDLGHCEFFFGVKEVPIPWLIHDKTYFFFSHTIKKQPHNKKLLQAVLEKRIRLIDYECLTDKEGNRIIAFGKYAGIVGTYNAFLTYGKRYNRFDLRRAYECFDYEDLKKELPKIKLPSVKIALTGGGRVSRGAMEVMDAVGIKKVNPEEFLDKEFNVPVYTQLHSSDYHRKKDGTSWDSKEFYSHPERFYSTFYRFEKVTDILISGSYWNPKAPALFTKEDMQREDFRIRIIADITCDIEGSIPCTKRPSSINDPVYDYNPYTCELEIPYSKESNVTVMAIDNLPGELARDASRDFGRQLMENVIPCLLGPDPDQVIERAIITRDGQLTPNFRYLQDYVR